MRFIVCSLVGMVAAIAGLVAVGVLLYSWWAKPGYDEAEFFSTAIDSMGREVPHGPVTRESGDGVVLCEGNYRVGVRDGSWRYYDRRGVLIAEETWSDGLLSSCEGEAFTTYGGFGFSSASPLLPVDSVQPPLTVYVVFEPVLKQRGTRITRFTPTTEEAYRTVVTKAVERFARERGASTLISMCSHSPMLQELGLTHLATTLTPRLVRVVVVEKGDERTFGH